jgi:ribosomal protein S18 acetylase RimI-like enzyme
MNIEYSMDPAHMQLDVVHAFLSGSYWSPGVKRSIVANAIRHSMVIGAFEQVRGRQVGFARVITDYSTFAYLCDVFVDPAFRDKGIARRMVGDLLAHPRLQSLRRFLLATRDAQALYAKLGFEPVHPDRWMEKRCPPQRWQEPGAAPPAC